MADIARPTSVLRGPSEKERKYDRQLRLWAASGQAALESASILLVNSGPGTVGVETLKNLVLPGIGHFIIADNSIVKDADLGVNFFLDSSHIGRSRAQSCAELLTELNPDVEGGWYPKVKGRFDLEELLRTSHTFTIILCTLPLEKRQIEILEDHSAAHSIPLVSVHCVGFYSYFKITLPGIFPIVETHPDETATSDLRLLDPWPELSSFSKEMTKNIEDLDKRKHGHLPMVVVLVHYLEEWKQSHNGQYPRSYKDKTSFREYVQNSMRRNNPEGAEENFEEAVAAVMKHVKPTIIPASLRQVFDYQQSEEKHFRSSFWIIADAVKQFYHKHAQLPLPGGLVDMKAESDVYVKLQNIYKDKARQDAAEVLATVRNTPGGEEIDVAEVESFCKNALFIKLVNSNQEVPKLETVIKRAFDNDMLPGVGGPEMPFSLLPIYIVLKATSHRSTASWQDILASAADEVPAAASNKRVVDAAREVSRAAGGELHNIAAMTGGMVAQEIIKIITKQYVPIDNTCIYDGVESRCQTLRL